MGTLSRARTGTPHAPQREPGRTTDCPSGTRTMQTLKKLPQIAPKTAAATMANGDDSQAALSAMPGNAKVSAGLKRILPPFRWLAPVVVKACALAACALAASACARGPGADTPRSTTTLAEALRPSFFAEALRRAGGAHYHGTTRFAAGGAAPDDGVTTTTDVWMDRAHGYRVAETNDRDGGREVVLVGRELFVALRYGKMIRRVAEEPEPTRVLEEALGGPWAAWEIAGPTSALERVAGPTGATLYRFSRATARTEDLATIAADKGLRAWRAGVVVKQVSGHALVDDATGALREVELSATFTAKRDGHDLEGAVDVRGTLTDVGATAAIAAPAAEELALRQRTVPEQRELLGGLPSTRPLPAPPPKLGAPKSVAPPKDKAP